MLVVHVGLEAVTDHLRSMRFLPHEHAAITAALAAVGIDPVSVLFVKRRGRLHVELPGRANTFAFYRARSTELDAEGRWVDRVAYFVGMDKKHPVAWADVLAAFAIWLQMN